MALDQREQEGLKYAELKGARSLAELRALPAADFFKPTPGSTGTPSDIRGPATDGWVLPAKHPAHEVPLIIGMVAGDAAFLNGFGPPAPPTLASYTSFAQTTYGDRAATFLKLYPPEKDSDVEAAKGASQKDRARVSIDVLVRGSGEKERKGLHLLLRSPNSVACASRIWRFPYLGSSLHIQDDQAARSPMATGRF